jgi:hypothetical protein
MGAVVAVLLAVDAATSRTAVLSEQRPLLRNSLTPVSERQVGLRTPSRGRRRRYEVGQHLEGPGLLTAQLHRSGTGPHHTAHPSGLSPQWKHHHHSGSSVALGTGADEAPAERQNTLPQPE